MDAGDRRAAPSRRAADARQDRRPSPTASTRAASQVDSDGVVDEPLHHPDEDHQEGRRPHLRLVRLEPALPRADEQRHRHHQVGDLSRHQAHLPRRADQRRHLRAAARSSSPKARSSTRSIRGRSRAAPPRSASASPRRCSPRSPRRSPTSCSRRPPAPRAISASAATIRERNRNYIMYLFTGGGYGGFQGGDGLTNGCSTIGISKMPPVEVLEQFYPVLFEEFSLREGSGGAGEYRGGFGVNYAIKLRRGEARVSMVMDHGRTGPQGALGGERRRRQHGGGRRQGGKTYRPPHLSKDQDIEIGVGDVVRVSTPGGGGFGDPAQARARGDRARRRARLLHARPRRARSSARQAVDMILRRGNFVAAAIGWLLAERRRQRGRSKQLPSLPHPRIRLVRRAGRGQCLHRRDAGRCPTIKHRRTTSPRAARRSCCIPTASRSAAIPIVAQTALYPADVDVTPAADAILQAALDDRAQQLAGGKWTNDRLARDRRARRRSNRSARWPAAARCASSSLLKDRRFVSLAFLGAGRCAAASKPSASSSR